MSTTLDYEPRWFTDAQATAAEAAARADEVQAHIEDENGWWTAEQIAWHLAADRDATVAAGLPAAQRYHHRFLQWFWCGAHPAPVGGVA